jgi:osmotically-inducible protein OsmY
MRAVGAFIAGAGVAYLFDPRSGRRRRNELRDRLFALVRRSGRKAARKATYVAGRAEGMAAQATHAVNREEEPTDPGTVKDRILSQAFREAGVPTKDVSVDVADGVVTLRGTIASSDLATTLIERVRAVPGVRTVTPRLTLATEEQ